VSLEKTCKTLRPFGTQARFKDVSVTLSDVTPCKNDAQFRNILRNLKYTRHLQVRVFDTKRGISLFEKLLERLRYLDLQTLRVLDCLNFGSYQQLEMLLTDPVKGAKLRSKLRTLQLPIRPLAETKTFRDNGQLNPSNEVFDCSAIVQFDSRRIEVTGWHDHSEDLTHGTPYAVTKQLIHIVGVESRQIESLSLLSTWGDLRQNPNVREYDNPFVGFGLHSTQTPVHLNELVFHDFSMFQVSEAMLTSISLPSLKSLKFIQCTELPYFLEHLMALHDQVRIQHLEVSSYNRLEALYIDDENNLERFCEAFSTLQTFKVDIWDNWQDDFDVNCLRSHQELETCVLSLGERPYSFIRTDVAVHVEVIVDNICKLRRNHPGIKSLAFRWEALCEPLEWEEWTPPTIRAIRAFARELVQFKKLEHLEIMFNRPSSLTYQTCERFARDIHGYLVEASEADCKINKIGLGARDAFQSLHVVDAGLVPKSELFDFGPKMTQPE